MPRVVVTLRAFPRTDVAQRVAKAVELAPEVETVLEVDLHHTLTGVRADPQALWDALDDEFMGLGPRPSKRGTFRSSSSPGR